MLNLVNEGNNYKVYNYTDVVNIEDLKKQLETEIGVKVHVNLYENTKTVIVTWEVHSGTF